MPRSSARSVSSTERFVAYITAACLLCACADDTKLTPVPLDAAVDAAIDATVEAGPVDAGVVPRGARVLALDIAAPQDGDYIAALARAKDAGIQATNVTILWRDLEQV